MALPPLASAVLIYRGRDGRARSDGGHPKDAPARLYGATRRHRGLQDDDLNDVVDDEDDDEEIAA
jgi:hypothetical protein